MTFRRKSAKRVFRKSGTAGAAAMIGRLEGGDEICGLTNGQFSLVDIVEHVLAETGPADVAIATWTMGIYDAERAYGFVRNNNIRRMRFVVDPSMFSRRPELASIIVRAFGVEAFRGVNSHAKFATVRSDRLAVCIRSSMNLNENRRIESFDLSCCNQTTQFFEEQVDLIWRKVPAENRSQEAGLFTRLFNTDPAPDPEKNVFLTRL
ncbi:MAG: hypothetical protein ACE5EM_11665 [Sphingomonadales bacterium]